MAASKTTTFRLPTEFFSLLDRLAKQLNATKTEIVEKSVLLTAGLLAEASRASYADLETIQEKYGKDARLVIGAFEENGKPEGKLLINGVDPVDVQALAFPDKAAGEVHMFLSVLRDHTPVPAFVQIGDEALFLPHPRMPVGTLPWPPKPHLAIQILLADIEEAAKAAEQQATELVEL